VNEVFSIFLDNRAEAQTGGPHGYWLSLPTTAEQVQEALKEIHITADNQQDLFIGGFSAPEGKPLELPEDLIKAASVDELNFLAAQLQRLDAVELAELNAAMQSPAKMQTIGQLLDYAENTDCFVLINAKDNRSLGEYYLNDSGLFVVPDPWKPAIDTDRLGSFIANEEQGTFTDYGYILRTSDEWQRVHEGQPVPEEYRVMAYPAPEILREESKVQPEAAAPTKAPQPVTPILLNGQNSAERMKEITDRLETGIQELFESERYKAYLTTMSKFHSYSFNNTLLIAMQGGQLVAGYNKWRDDFHRNVKKGEKAIKILAPAPFKAKKEVQKLDAQGRPVMGKDGKPVTEVQEIQVPAFKIVSVFDVSQTEGEPLPSIGVEELTGSVERYGEFFKALEQTSPVPIGFEDIPGGSHGYYHLTEKRIAIQEGMSELQTLKTAIHEIAHSKLHAIDPEAPAIEQADRPDSRTREVQAESVAYAVCQHYGLDTSDYSFGYVAGWSSGKDLKELKASLETIRATAHELITTIDGHLAQLQKERQTQQEQPQTAPLEQAAEQPDPDSVFSKLPTEQQQEITDSVKAMLQTLIDADLKSTGEVSQGTKEAAQAQGFTIAGDGTLEQAEAPQEAAYRLKNGDYLYIQTSETGYDYTLYGPDYKELDGGQLDNPGLSLAEAGKEILAIHELPAGTMEPLTGDRLDGFLEATEQANAIPQPQAWNGIDGLLNGKPFMPEASPADRAAALIELAEKNAPRLGSEERQLIVAYAEAVGDNDKVIGLINRLCEQGYELQKGQMDSFVKSEIESEIAVANAQRQIAQNPAAEPVVTILWSESPHLKDGQQMPLHEAEAVFKELDSARRHEREQPGYTGHWYDKTKFRIDFTMQGQPDSYEGRQDFGDGDGSLIQHIRGYHEYYAQDESWKNHVLHHEGPEAWEADKAQRDMLLHEFIPYMELHCNLAAMEQEARRPLRSGETLTPEQTAYFNAVLDYVKECRPLLNQGQYHLPEPPQLADFDQSLQDYKKQIEAELEQEAAAAGLTVEEYVASDYEAPAQPNFSIYQVPPGPEGRDFRYRSYEDLQADGLSVDRKNYQLVYTAPLDKDTTLDEIYRRFNIEHPADYKGHSLSTGDIVVFRQDGKQTAYYVDEGADYRQVPEFFAQPEKQLTPDECMTGEQIQTPRGRFYLTDRSREQMEAAGYGFHHQSEDGRYLIMANGTRAFAIPAQPESHIKTAEMSTEQNYNMIDGMMNNAPSMGELEARAKAGEQISLLDVAEAAKAEAKKPKQTRKTTQKQKKPSIRAQLAAAKEEQKKKPPAREKSKEMEV
jgi:antirestriction protein ArdC